MIRDFSDAAMWELINLIDEISDEQWIDMTDTIGDACYIGLDIEDYIHDVEAYYRKILDKNDTSRSDIEKIFSDVEEVALHYKAVFREAAETIQQQAEYVKKLASCMDGNIVLKDIRGNMEEALVSLESSHIEFYMAQMRRGENTGEYDWEYITGLFQSNPEDVSQMAYGAMIRIFNEMIISDQEKFIECAYTEHGTLHELYPYYIYTDVPVLRREIRLSPVYTTMVSIYCYILSSEVILTDNMRINNKLFTDYNILASVSAHGKVVYVRGFKEGNESVNITLKEVNDFNEHDYLITYEGGATKDLNTHLNTIPTDTFEIEIYGMREGDSLSNVINMHMDSIIETMHVDISTELAKEAANNLISVIVGDAISVVQDSVAYYYTICEGVEINQKLDTFQEMRYDTDVFMTLGINANLSFCDNKYIVHSFYIVDEGKLQENIEMYNNWAKENGDYEQITFGVTDVRNAFAQGQLHRLENFDVFMKWYLNKETDNGGVYETVY